MDKGSEFYNRSMKSRLGKNDIETYSTYNEQTSVVAERFIIILKNKIYRYNARLHVYIDNLDDIVNKTITHIIVQLKETYWCKIELIYWL